MKRWLSQQNIGRFFALAVVCMALPLSAQPDLSRWIQLIDQRAEFPDFSAFEAEHPEAFIQDAVPHLAQEIAGLDALEEQLLQWESLPDLENLALKALMDDGMRRWQIIGILADLYMPEIVPAVENVGLPSSFAWIPAMLTGFDYAYAGPGDRGGLWALDWPSAQILLDMSKDGVDERMYAGMCTEAAVAQLSALSNRFPDDPLRVLVAYVKGPGYGNNWSGEPGDDPLLDQWLILYRVVARLWENLERDRLTVDWIADFAGWEVVPCPGPVDRISMVEWANLDRRAQRTYLPWWTGAFVNCEDWNAAEVRLPSALAQQFNAVEWNEWSPHLFEDYSQSHTSIHRVKSGEVLGLIARQYGVSVQEIKTWNALKTDLIRVGQELEIRGVIAPTTAKPTDRPTTRIGIHTVKEGETLWSISKEYPGVSVEQLMELNPHADPLIIGATLRIPLE